MNITNSIIENNSIINWGGGIYNGGPFGVLNIIDSKINNNQARQGGWIYVFSSNVNITNSTFGFNNASIEGGGIFSYGDNITVRDSIFENNSATQNGGAISIDYCTPSIITIDNTTIARNNASYGGGIYQTINNSIIHINNSTLEDNYASIAGGAVFNSKGNMTINGSNVINNTIGNDVAIQNEENGTLILNNSIIKDNYIAISLKWK